jgi:hypothetical protein
MGMFDSVYTTCKNCGTQVEFQSKAGECRLASYHLSQSLVPVGIAVDLDGKSVTCKCGAVITLRAPFVDHKIMMWPEQSGGD